MTEGDIAIVFSQFGEVVDINLMRDERTGKPKGFAFLAYEDTRSCILAVDNMNGYYLLQRQLSVDHVEDYKVPKRGDRVETGEEDLEGNKIRKLYEASGAEGAGAGVYGTLESTQKQLAVQKEKAAIEIKEIRDKDESWAAEFDAMLTGGKKKKKDKKEKKEKKEKKDKKDKKEKKEDKKDKKEKEEKANDEKVKEEPGAKR